MHECIASELVSCPDHQVSTCYEVVGCCEISGACDEVRLLMSLTCEAEDVRSDFLDLAESLRSSRNSLIDDDCLHERIICETADNRDCCLLLLHEVVRICHVLDNTAICYCTIFRDESLSSAEIVLGL